jgi:hypothetical protein
VQPQNIVTNADLFHYCSMQTLLAILENKTLRLSSINHMNDCNELRYFQRLAMQHIKEIPDLTDDDRGAIELFYAADRLDQQDHVSLEAFANTYCFCLSTQPDDLSQWRGYGDDGHGVAIGFCRSMLVEFANKRLDFSFVPIQYNEPAAIDALRALGFSNPAGSLFRLVSARRAIDRLAAQFKDPAFEAEHEWRLIYSPAGAVYETADGPAFRAMLRNKTVVPCYDIPIDKFLVESITLGPNVSQMSEVGLARLLDARGYLPMLQRSKIGYRSRF